MIDYILLNNNHRINAGILKRYKDENAFPVEDDLGEPKIPQIIRTDLLCATVYQKAKGDCLQRSIIRHDQNKLAKAIMNFIR